MIKSDEILQQLDSCSHNFTFPMLDNGYVYPAGTKLTAYRDNTRWVIIIEVIGFSYRGGGHNGITNCLHVFGNCLTYAPGTANENFLYITNDSPDGKTFDDEEYFYLNPDSATFLLRGGVTPIEHDRDKYKQADIILEDDNRINAFEFLRLLDHLYHDQLVATENEIRQRIPMDIPKILELHEWSHPDVITGELPSAHETFIQLSKVLETGDVGHYQPTLRVNTHWRHWPDGGTL